MVKREKLFEIENLLMDIDEILQNADKLMDVLKFHIESAAYFVGRAFQLLNDLRGEKEER
jgi:hypothetical protein